MSISMNWIRVFLSSIALHLAVFASLSHVRSSRHFDSVIELADVSVYRAVAKASNARVKKTLNNDFSQKTIVEKSNLTESMANSSENNTDNKVSADRELLVLRQRILQKLEQEISNSKMSDVVLLLQFSSDGSPQKFGLKKSSGNAKFDSVVLNALKHLDIEPTQAYKNLRVELPVHFIN